VPGVHRGAVLAPRFFEPSRKAGVVPGAITRRLARALPEALSSGHRRAGQSTGGPIARRRSTGAWAMVSAPVARSCLAISRPTRRLTCRCTWRRPDARRG